MPCYWLLIQLFHFFTNCCHSQKEANFVPIILGWNCFFNEGNVIRTIAPEEQVNKCRRKCEYSEDRNTASNASVVVFHANALNSVPSHRHSNQLYVMFDLESPSHSHIPYPSSDFFNLTMTYRANDEYNLMAPYGSLRKIGPPKRDTQLEDIWRWEEVMEKVKRKDKMALQIASNCASNSAREVYTKELSKHIEVTGYGHCFGRNCDKKCYDTEIDRHFFYLAFENSVCRNYVTEKFWNALRHLTVPVVLSRKVLKGLDIPSDAFVAADDFGTVAEMAKFLMELRLDQDKYLSFFNWTRFFRRNSDFNPTDRAICRLCEFAHQRLAPGTKVIDNIDHYWRLQGNCFHGFANQFIQKHPLAGTKIELNLTQKSGNGLPAGVPFPCSRRSINDFFLMSLILLLIIFVAHSVHRFFNLPVTLSIRNPHQMIKHRVPIVNI